MGLAKSSASHQNNFNLIRLVAAIQVLLVHGVNHFGLVGPVPTALKVVPGVPTFFFISGMLICMSYERTRQEGNRAFFINRALRIFPALLVCVVLATLSVYLSGYFDGRAVDWRRIAAWMVGQSTIFQFYNPPFMRDYGVGVLNGALWTISVELQFYILAPLLFFLLRKRPALLLAAFVGSMLLNLYFRFWLDWNNLVMKLAYVSFMPWVYMFITGFCIAGIPALRSWVAARARLRYLVPAYVASMILIGGYSSNASNDINPVSFALLGAIILRASTLPIPVLGGLQTFIRRNDFSYGLYLYHMPIINFLLFSGLTNPFAGVAWTVLAGAVAATASWYLVEKPALGFKH